MWVDGVEVHSVQPHEFLGRPDCLEGHQGTEQLLPLGMQGTSR